MAAWSLVELDNEGDLIGFLRGVAPANLMQSNVSAEHLGLANFSENSQQTATLVVDYQPLAKFDNPERRHGVELGKTKYAGILGTARCSDRWPLPVTWVRSHQEVTTENLDVVGNSWADRHAKEACSMHTHVEYDVGQADVLFECCREWFQFVAAALHMHGCASKEQQLALAGGMEFLGSLIADVATIPLFQSSR